MTGKEDPTKDSRAGTPADEHNKAAAGNVGEVEPLEEKLVENHIPDALTVAGHLESWSSLNHQGSASEFGPR